jgi:hypothetical protein
MFSEPGMHLHHRDVPVEVFKEHHAVIAFQQLSKLVTDYVLGNSGTVTPPSPWYMGLSTRAVSNYARDSVWNVSATSTNITEIGTTTPASYARQSIARSIATGSIDWGTSTFDSTLSTGGQSSAADQVTFGAFSGAPSPNGANAFVLTDGTTLNAGNPYFAGDTAATRTFASGDTEKVTATLKAG